MLGTRLKTAFALLMVISIFSCSKDDDLGNLNETIVVRHKNADMPAYIRGNGAEKVFLITLHGGPGGLGLSLRKKSIKNEIEKTCAVVYFDQRGSGNAQGHYSDNGISLDIMAEDVLALVKVLKHKYGSNSRFYLMGHSWGGVLGTATLLKDQSAFLGWIAVDGNHNPKGLYMEYIANFKRVAAEQIALGNSIDFWNSVTDFLQEIDTTAFNQNDFRKLNRKAGEAEKKLGNDNIIVNQKDDNIDHLIFKYNAITFYWNLAKTQSILDEDQGIWRNISFTDRLSEIKIPALILWGKHDMVVPPAFAQEAYDHLGSNQKRLVIFEQSGHAPFVSEPDPFAQEVIAFINRNK